MIISYLKIWISIVKKYTSIKTVLILLLENLFYFLVIYFFLTQSIVNSLFILILLVIMRSSIKIVVFLNNLKKTGDYNLVLLKPIDPLFGLIAYNHSPLDILILFPVLVYIKIKNRNLINPIK